ncbi:MULTISPECIES: pathogenicity island protein [unclassified Staphylococcus]|uniref:TscA family type II toxin-antitoxin system antitoxin n=1 Tax=unclassified Staphylococcus TaxID=91994 RepID=UPI001AEC2155|nr:MULTISPECIES: pathogenicity island protein [unclassified Staphylococcus]
MNQTQLEILNLVFYQLKISAMQTEESYEHTVYEDGKENTYEINREQHLEEIMKWAVQELNNNFELGEF